MEENAARWSQWLDSYRHAAAVAVQKLDLAPAPEVPAQATGRLFEPSSSSKSYRNVGSSDQQRRAGR
jgi:hypothetical protein